MRHIPPGGFFAIEIETGRHLATKCDAKLKEFGNSLPHDDFLSMSHAGDNRRTAGGCGGVKFFVSPKVACADLSLPARLRHSRWRAPRESRHMFRGPDAIR